MSFLTQLDASQLITLRGSDTVAPSFQSATYLSVWQNPVIFAAQVNQVSFAASFAQVAYDNVTTGAYTAIKEGQRIFFSHTNNIYNAHFIGRIRPDNGTVATSTLIYINETSANIQNNDYIFVIDDHAITDKLGRQVSGTQYTDYNHTFRQLLPVIYNLKSAYAGFTTSDALTIAFAPLAIAATSGASISSWLWDVGDGTIISGSTTTQNITATFPAGQRWVRLAVTDSGGRVGVRWIPVSAHDDSYPPIPLQSGDLEVSCDVSIGYSATAAAWDGVQNILDNTLVIAWTDDLYQDDTTSLTGDNIAFVGRFRQSNDSSISDPVVSLTKEVRYTIEGPLQQLARIEMLPYEIDNSGAPTAWFQVKTLTPWRAVCLMLSEFSTFLELHSLSFDDTSNAYTVLGLRTQSGNILGTVNDLYYSLNGAMQINPAGQGQCVRDLRMSSTTVRNAAVTVANWDTRDLLSIDDYSHDNVKTVGRLKATGGSYQAATNQYATYESLAPGVAQDYPEGSASLDRQVLQANQTAANAQSELNTRAGYAFAKAQPADRLEVTHPDGYYGVLIPALDTWYTFTLSADDTLSRPAIDSSIRWLLIAVSISHDSVAGEKTVKATYTRETTGAAGQSVVYPPIQAVPYTPPIFPPFDPFPAFPVDPGYYLPPGTNVIPYNNPPSTPSDGNTVLVSDDLNQTVQITTNYITNGLNPLWRDITPPGTINLVTDARFDRVNNGAYAISNNGSLSQFHYASNPFAGPPSWVDTDLNDGGIYDTVEPTDTAGTVYVKGLSGGSESLLLDVSTYNGGNGQDMGIAIVSGEVVSISATGTVYYDITNTTTPAGVGGPLAGGVLPSAPVGRLLARIGTSGTWQNIGASGSFTAPADGNLHLIMNDVDNPTDYADNSGNYTIEVGIYWDFRVDDYGVTVGDFTGFPAANVPDLGVVGSYVPGSGFRTEWVENYFADYDGDFIRLILPNVIRLAAITEIIIYSSQTTVIPITATSGAPGMTPFFLAHTYSESGADGSGRGTYYQLYTWPEGTDARTRSLEMSYLTGDGNHTDITGIEFIFSSTPSDVVVTRYSTDFGATFDPFEIVGVPPSLGSGIAAIQIGTPILVGAGSQVYKASAGGSYSPYGGTIPPGAEPNALYIPRLVGTLENINTSTPVYYLGSGILSNDGESLWKVSNSGSLYTAISPKIGGTAGLIVGPRAINAAFADGNTILAIAQFNSGVKFCVTVNQGANWKFTDLQARALGVDTRRGDFQHQQAVIANGSLGGYVPNYSAGTVMNYDRNVPGYNVSTIDVFG